MSLISIIEIFKEILMLLGFICFLASVFLFISCMYSFMQRYFIKARKNERALNYIRSFLIDDNYVSSEKIYHIRHAFIDCLGDNLEEKNEQKE